MKKSTLIGSLIGASFGIATLDLINYKKIKNGDIDKRVHNEACVISAVAGIVIADAIIGIADTIKKRRGK